MLRNKLVRSDGSIIDSSVIISCELSEEVNSDTNLMVGDVTSSELYVEILATVRVEQDEMLTYYIIEDGVETLIGEFKVEKPTIASRTTMRFTAYDNVLKTEKVFSDWLIQNQSMFPMSLLTLTQAACDYCGVSLATADFPHAELSVGAFYGDGITCRQVLGWAAAIAGRFVRANTAGEIEFAWYTEIDGIICTPSSSSYAADITVTDDGEGNIAVSSPRMTVNDDGNGNVTVDIPGVQVLYSNGNVTFASETVVPYFMDGISYESYATDVIEQVRINHSEADVGISFPTDATGNCFTISGNMILGACAVGDVAGVAASLYNQLSQITYTPMKIRVPRTIKVRAGDIVRLYTPTPVEKTLRTYVMRVSITASGTSIESTGDKSYGTNAAVSSQKYTNLTGKMMSMKIDTEGLESKNTDLEGRVSRIAQTVQGLETTVLDTTKDLNDLKGDTTNQITNTIQTAKELIQSATSTLVTSDGLEERVSEVRSEFSQTAEGFRLQFESQGGLIDKVTGDLKKQNDERTKYIRFVDGDIILGEEGNSVTLTIKNDRISFTQNGDEVAYLAASDKFRKLYIVDGEFLGNLQVGTFAFIPRTEGANKGNLSFKKVSV